MKAPAVPIDDSKGRYALVGAVAILCAFTARSIAPALAPESLWVDDLWPAVLAGKATFREIFAIDAPVSPFFILLLRVATIPALGDFSLQILPLVAALAGIPLVAIATRGATGSRAAAVVGAALFAANPLVVTYAARVKPFTFDALAIALLLLLAARDDESDRGTAFDCAVGALLAAFSFTTVFFSLPLCVVRFARMRTRSAAMALGGYSVAVAVIFVVVMAPRSSDGLRTFWRDYYLDVSAPAVASVRLVELFGGAFPPALRVLAVLIPVGILALWRRKPLLAVASAASYILLIVAALLERYPVGTGRTEIFTYPVSILLAATALHALLRRWTAAAVVVAVVVSLWLVTRNPVSYVPSHDRTVVSLANEMVQPEDTLLIYPFSTWAVAHYGKWPVRLVETSQTTNAFYAWPERENTLVLGEKPEGVDFRSDPAVVRKQLEPLLRTRPRRIWLVATSAEPRSNGWIVESLSGAGYEITASRGFKGAGFALFESKGGHRRPPSNSPR